MLTIIPVLLLLLTAGMMAVIQRLRPTFAYFWLIAASGSFLTWLVVLFSGLRLPQSITLVVWQPETLYPSSPGLILDSTSWPFALALTTLVLAVILTAVARLRPIDWRAWVSSLALTAFGLLTVLARNPLTLLMAWAALDFLELIILLVQISERSARESTVTSITARIIGLLFLSAAIIQAASAGSNLSFDSIPSQASMLLLLAAVLRLGVFPLNKPLRKEPSVRSGLGTTLRLVPAASGMVLLARVSSGGVTATFSPWLLLLAALAGLYGAWNWAASDDELEGRPFWIIAAAALVTAAAVRGQPEASLAWGLACLLAGGVLFLNSVHTREMLPFSILGLIAFSALPFSLAWNGVGLYQTSPAIPLPAPYLIFLSAITLVTHALLICGYVAHILRPADMPPVVERWVWVIYPFGLVVLLISAYLLGFLMRPAIEDVSWTGWAGGAASLVLAGIIWILGTREIHIPWQLTGTIRRVFSINWFSTLIWIIFQAGRGLIDWITLILEGDGGILWAILLLALIFSLLARQGLGG
jgi:hypothetical protein